MFSVHKITSSKMSSHFSEVKNRAQNTSEYPCPSAIDKPSVIRGLKNFSRDLSSGTPFPIPISFPYFKEVSNGSGMGDGWLGVTRKEMKENLLPLKVI